MKFLTATHTHRRSALVIALVCLMVLTLSPARAAAQQGAATTILGQVTDEFGKQIHLRTGATPISGPRRFDPARHVAVKNIGWHRLHHRRIDVCWENIGEL